MPRYQSKSDPSIQVEAFLAWPAKGDWIVKNPDNKLSVIGMESFRERYTLIPEGDDASDTQAPEDNNPFARWCKASGLHLFQ